VPKDLDALATDLHAAADELRQLPAVVPLHAVAMFERARDHTRTTVAAAAGAEGEAPDANDGSLGVDAGASPGR
jgi:hypothetical protein